MTIEHGIPYAFKEELAKGTHNMETDVLKLALYDSTASLTLAGTTEYTSTGEIANGGYAATTLVRTAGYPKMNASEQGGIAAGSAWMIDFDDVQYATQILEDVRGAMIYNETQGNKAVALLNFGGTFTVAGNFTISWPTADPLNCIIRSI